MGGSGSRRRRRRQAQHKHIRTGLSTHLARELQKKKKERQTKPSRSRSHEPARFNSLPLSSDRWSTAAPPPTQPSRHVYQQNTPMREMASSPDDFPPFSALLLCFSLSVSMQHLIFMLLLCFINAHCHAHTHRGTCHVCVNFFLLPILLIKRIQISLANKARLTDRFRGVFFSQQHTAPHTHTHPIPPNRRCFFCVFPLCCTYIECFMRYFQRDHYDDDTVDTDTSALIGFREVNNFLVAGNAVIAQHGLAAYVC